jgi:UDP-N-acetylglucosamine acyltransferase
MIAGNVRVNQDVLPYGLHSDFNITPKGLNLVGLRRAGFSREDIAELRRAYKTLFFENLKLADAIAKVEQQSGNAHVRHLTAFIRASKRGIPRPRRSSRAAEIEE